MHKVSIIASAEEGVVTKTIVDEDPTHVYEGGRIGIYWNSQDKIGVYGSSNVNIAFASNLISGETKGTALFTGSMSANDTPLYAYYPHSQDNNNVSYKSVTGTVPAIQSFNVTSRVIPADYKIGYPKADRDGEFTFVNVLSLLRFKVDATNTELANDILQSITLKFPAGSIVCGRLTMNLESRTCNITSSTEANTLTLNIAGATSTLSNELTAYMSCAPIQISGQPIEITITTSKHIASFKTNLNTDFQHNTLYNFPLKLSEWAKLGDKVSWSLSDNEALN